MYTCKRTSIVTSPVDTVLRVMLVCSGYSYFRRTVRYLYARHSDGATIRAGGFVSERSDVFVWPS